MRSEAGELGRTPRGVKKIGGRGEDPCIEWQKIVGLPHGTQHAELGSGYDPGNNALIVTPFSLRVMELDIHVLVMLETFVSFRYLFIYLASTLILLPFHFSYCTVDFVEQNDSKIPWRLWCVSYRVDLSRGFYCPDSKLPYYQVRWDSTLTATQFYGYDQGVFGNVIINGNFLDTFGHPSADTQGTMTSIYNIGCFVGAMSTIFTGDYFGRPRQILLGSTVIAIGAIIQTAAYGVPQMMVGRVVAGLGTGMNTATAGVWQSETSKMRSRGKLVIIQMANCITGFSISNWLTLGFAFAPRDVAWRSVSSEN